jgi:hypothetical protein
MRRKLQRRMCGALPWRSAGFLTSSLIATADVFPPAGSVAALLDGRALKRGETRATLVPQGDVDLIAATATFACRGRVIPAVRDLVKKGRASGLSDTTLDLASRGGSKSYVNRRIVDAVKRDVKMTRPYVLGKKAVDNATAYIERDYS